MQRPPFGPKIVGDTKPLNALRGRERAQGRDPLKFFFGRRRRKRTRARSVGAMPASSSVATLLLLLPLAPPASAALASPRFDAARAAPFHPRIHLFGNTGPSGYVHARLAEAATRLIDRVAYSGRDVRRDVAASLAAEAAERARAAGHAGAPHVLDVGCGIGTLTLRLAEQGLSVVGMDTSAEMLSVARERLRTHEADGRASLVRADGMDAAETMRGAPVHAAVASFVMHELPAEAHEGIVRSLAEATRATRGSVWVVDIHPAYEPSAPMLWGEPFLLAYLASCDAVFARVAEEVGMSCDAEVLVDGHVKVWRMRHRDASSSAP